MNGLRRNDDAMKRLAGTQKKNPQSKFEDIIYHALF
jgi:hypothetical protein